MSDMDKLRSDHAQSDYISRGFRAIPQESKNGPLLGRFQMNNFDFHLHEGGLTIYEIGLPMKMIKLPPLVLVEFVDWIERLTMGPTSENAASHGQP